MRTDCIYRIAWTPVAHTYVTFNEDGTFQDHYSMKRALLAKPDAPVVVLVPAKEA
jgi:hypothetical protein